MFGAYKYADELGAIQQRQQARDAANRTVESVTAQQARAVADISDLYPWMPPSLTYGLGRYFGDAFHERVAGMAEKALDMAVNDPAGFAQMGERINASAYVRQASGYSGLWMQKAAAQGADPLELMKADQTEQQKGLVARAIPHIDNPVSRQIAAGYHAVEGTGALDPLKAMSRGAFTILDYPREYAQGYWRSLSDQLTQSVRDVQEAGFGGALRRGFDPERMARGAQLNAQGGAGNMEAFRQTTLGQTIDQVTAHPGQKIDAGTGFFMGGELKKSVEDQQKQYGVWIYPDGTQHARTLGRDFAAMFSEPGSKPFTFASGLVDAGVAVGADAPLLNLQASASAAREFQTLGAAGKRAIRAAESGKELTAFDRGLDSIGALMHPGGRAIVDPKLSEAWVTRNTDAVKLLAKTKDPYEMWRVTGGRLGGDEIRALTSITDEGVMADYLKRQLLSSPDISKAAGRWTKLGISIDRNAPRGVVSMLDKVPLQRINLRDESRFLEQIERHGKNFKLGDQAISEYFKRAVKIDPNDMLATASRRNVMDDLIDAGTEQIAMREAGKHTLGKLTSERDALAAAGDEFGAARRQASIDARMEVAREKARKLTRLEKRYRLDAEVAYWLSPEAQRSSFVGAMIGGEVIDPLDAAAHRQAARSLDDVMGDLNRAPASDAVDENNLRMTTTAIDRRVPAEPGLHAVETGDGGRIYAFRDDSGALAGYATLEPTGDRGMDLLSFPEMRMNLIHTVPGHEGQGLSQKILTAIEAEGIPLDRVARNSEFTDAGRKAFGKYFTDTRGSGRIPLPPLIPPSRPLPSTIADLVSDYMPGPQDPRAVRRAMSSPLARAIWKMPVVPGVLTLGDLEKGLLTVQDKWKSMQILRAATTTRVVGDEMMRMVATGMDGPMNHPLSYLAAVISNSNVGKRMLGEGEAIRGLDALGQQIAMHEEFVGEFLTGSQRSQNIYREVKRVYGDGRVAIRGPKFDEAGRLVQEAEPGFYEAWANQLARTSTDPLTRLILGAPNLDEAKRIYWEHMGDMRKKLSRILPDDPDPRIISGKDLLERWGSDMHIDYLAERLNTITGGDPRIVDILRKGVIDTAHGSVPIWTRQGLDQRVIDELGTTYQATASFMPGVIGVKAIEDAGHRGIFNAVTDALFSKLYAAPDNVLARSETYRQMYWDRIGQMSPMLDPAERAKLIANAEKAKIGESALARIKGAAGTYSHDSPLDLEELHSIAKASALHDAKDLLFDLHSRGQFFDAMRLVFPFGEAWRELMKTWPKLIWNDPHIIATVGRTKRALEDPHVAQLIGADEKTVNETGDTVSRGLLYKNGNGEQVFAFPMSKQMMQLTKYSPVQKVLEALPGAPDLPAQGLPSVPMTGRVRGLNIGFETLPGFGPVATVALSHMLPDGQALGGIEDVLFPYGRPEGTGLQQGIKAALPSWWTKVMNVSGSFDMRQYAGQTADIGRYYASTEEFKVQGQGASDEEVQRWWRDTKDASAWMMFLRGTAQGVLPTSPTYEFYVEDGQGQRLPILALSDDLQRMREQDPQNYVLNFLQRHGDAAFALLQGKTVSLSPGGGLPPTKDAEAWLSKNKDVRESYPLAYGFFAPQGGKLDLQAYEGTLKSGDREMIDPKIALNASNAIVAKAIYYKQRDQLPQRLTAEMSLYLYNLRTQLSEQYPGYDPNGGEVIPSVAGTHPLPSKAAPDVVIDQLKKAVGEDKVKDSTVTEPLKLYLDARDKAIAASRANNGKDDSWITQKGGAPLREWLFNIGTSLVEENPDFASVWEMALLREFDSALLNDQKAAAK